MQESAGKRVGVGNRKAGNAWLKWAFSEAAVLGAQKDERIGGLLRRLASRLGKAKALSALAENAYYPTKKDPPVKCKSTSQTGRKLPTPTM